MVEISASWFLSALVREEREAKFTSMTVAEEGKVAVEEGRLRMVILKAGWEIRAERIEVPMSPLA